MSRRDDHREARALSSRPAPPRGRGGIGWFLAGYAGVAGFLVIEATSRDKGAASSVQALPDDQGTTRVILSAYALAAGLPMVLRSIRRPKLPPVAGPAGLIAQVAGLGLRARSMRELGRFYSRTLRTDGDKHAVVDTGPYRLIRHPGYVGSLLIWGGFLTATYRRRWPGSRTRSGSTAASCPSLIPANGRIMPS